MFCAFKSATRGIVALVFSLSIAPVGFAVEANKLSLKIPISNNAVAFADGVHGPALYSFNGLKKGKDWRSVTNAVQGIALKTGQPFIVKDVPFKEGRLASIAVTINKEIYLFGGYTVAENHEEKSMPDVYRFNPKNEQFELVSKMPIPVDDTVALVYKKRFIYLISGWHDIGNIADVQVLDTQTMKWYFATPYPGSSVFGHSGGIVGESMVIVDGVKVDGIIDGKRNYKMASQSYLGKIDPDDFTKINWSRLSDHPGKAMYRMAAVGSIQEELIVFAAGSDNPYNYNGIGYDGVPSKPSDKVFAWDLKFNQWKRLPSLASATMDHRGLLEFKNSFYILGGMHINQNVSEQVIEYSLKK
ncbi:MAG: hypothetical protein OQJ89_03480 [Kangiellaceae bacterium]|nr:hypothetical protein [Kangiellaceae bacterium]MCW8999794.1 hypothetical protein [Kangiellaceae bacterium]MCW9015999.1 hypothetical protein [Kangiellaceae bacterium]